MAPLARLKGYALIPLAMLLLAATSAVAQCETAAQQIESRLRGLYGVKGWPGKSGPIRDGFRITPEMLPSGLSLSRSTSPDPSINPETGEVFVRRSYTLYIDGRKDSIPARVTVAESCAEAQEQLFHSLVNVSRMQPPLTPRGVDHGLSLGDVCYCRPSDGGFRFISWVRNNVFVHLLADDDEGKLLLGGLARTLDAAIVERSTSKSYRLSPARPIIDQVKAIGPRSWDTFSIRVPGKVGIDRLWSGELFSLSNKKGWPVAFQIVVTEDNMLGFPLSGIAKWVQDGPEADKASADIEAFLCRFNPLLPEPGGKRR